MHIVLLDSVEKQINYTKALFYALCFMLKELTLLLIKIYI